MSPIARRWTLAGSCVFAMLLALIALRMAGASDLYHNRDQTKTMAYTTDIVLNGRWALPRDNVGSFARKPPLVNWLGAPFQGMGLWSEWAFKVPCMISALAATALTMFMAYRQIARCRPEHLLRLGRGKGRGRAPEGDEAGRDPGFDVAAAPVDDAGGAGWGRKMALAAIGAAAAAGAMYLANPSTTKHVYFLRPNMLNAAVMALAWASATVALDPATRRPGRWALTFWLATAATALSIGPTAFENLAYAAVAPFVIGRGWPSVRRLGWLWGLPLTLAIVGAWLGAAYLQAPDFVVHQLIGGETVKRVVDASDHSQSYLLVILGTAWVIPGYFFERMAPWSIPAFAAIVAILIRPDRWRSHPMTPAVLWVLCVMLVLLPVASKGGTFTMPAYPAAAVLAAYALVRPTGWLQIRAGRLVAAAAVVMVAIGLIKGFATSQAKTHPAERIKAFAADVRPVIGEDPVVFTKLNPESDGFSALPSLLGRHQAGAPTEAMRRDAAWHITSIAHDAAAPDSARVVSERIDRYADDGFAGVRYVLLPMDRPRPGGTERR